MLRTSNLHPKQISQQPNWQNLSMEYTSYCYFSFIQIYNEIYTSSAMITYIFFDFHVEESSTRKLNSSSGAFLRQFMDLASAIFMFWRYGGREF